MIASRPPSGPPSSARSARAARAAAAASRPAGRTWTARGATPSERTDSGGRSSGATEASTSAATVMISAGVR